MTDFRMPSPTLDVVSIAPADAGDGLRDRHSAVLTASQLVTRLGGYPTLTFPIYGKDTIEVTPMWEFLREPADFFGVPLPSVSDLRDAVARFTGVLCDRLDGRLIAATVTLIDVDGGRFLVSGSADFPVAAEPVRVGLLDSGWTKPAGTDPYWLRMAARTTSLAAVDHLLGRLRQLECIDGIPPGSDVTAPLAGALVVDTGESLVGLAGTEPVSVLDQLENCGLLRPDVVVRRSSLPVADAHRAWWISPQYRTHPVAQIGERAMPVDSAHPSFLEQQ
ncbi:hypothetical protein [Mycobacterium sp. OTB74]|uniref:hypothetical protein n=1 Tax=Mycobacterium sp. OTB74 TaxID=1853452 RepID=UPI00247699BE|nr:hypothetical protein [Mycobacterium sp. OTB74]MDH6244227.1 hypothetical protein [Mycobacterium sp. OTB74]